MKILVVLSRFPYPLFKGDKLRAFHHIRMLSQENEIYLICLSESAPDSEGLEALKPYCQQIEVIGHSYLKSRTKVLGGLFNKIPLQVNYFSNNKMKKKIEEWIKELQIDLVYVQLVRLGENIPFGLGPHYHLDFQDAMSYNMKRRYHHSKNYEKRLIKEEEKRLLAYESKIAKKFDTLSAISLPDIKYLNKNVDQDIFLLPNGVNEQFLDFPLQEQKEYDLIFTGNMGYHPNVVACKYLVNELKPMIEEVYRPISICLAGTNPTNEVKSLAGETVTVTGRVPDLRPYLAKSNLFVAPLFSGSGLQNKLLESMAMRLPSITTHLANNALKAKPNQEIIVCNDRQAFTRTIVTLLEDKAAAKQIGESGRAFIEQNYMWESYNDAFKEFLGNHLNNV